MFWESVGVGTGVDVGYVTVAIKERESGFGLRVTQVYQATLDSRPATSQGMHYKVARRTGKQLTHIPGTRPEALAHSRVAQPDHRDTCRHEQNEREREREREKRGG